VEGPGAIGGDRRLMGAALPERVLAHRGEATPDAEGGHEVGWVGEAAGREQPRRGDRRPLGGGRAPQEGHPAAQAQAPSQAAPQASTPAQGGDTATIAPARTQTAAPGQSVDVGAVLSEMASMKGGGGNYQSSIVDLLKLLDMDSSLDARKQLANELNVHVGADGSAEENIALHKAVMDKLAENGGVVPDSLRH
jgi:hypothetical protein